MSEQIDVQQIMQQLREEIKKKGYTANELSFNDVVVEGCGKGQTFDVNNLSCHIEEASAVQRVDLYRPVGGNALKRLIKKTIRKIIGLVLTPITLDQERYNASMVNSMNQVYLYICQKEDEIEELKQRIEELEKTAEK